MILWLVPEVLAHRPGLSYARIDPDALTLTFARPELANHIPMEDLEASRVLIAELTLDQVEVSAGGVRCTLSDPTVTAVEGDGVAIRAALLCPSGEGRYRAGFLGEMEPGHRHYVEVEGAAVAMLDAGAPETSFTAAQGSVAGRFFGLGVEHIWTGYDHLAFLFGLLLTARRLRDMLVIVTGFTVAHSITLTLAALGYVTLPPALVEPAIAASIVVVGVENFWRPPARRRVILTFLLGLIHGFGFAGMLAQLGLPRHALATALVCFNGGVEVGQAAVVAVVLPLLLWLRRYDSFEKRAVPLGSAGLALAGLYWLVERLVGV